MWSGPRPSSPVDPRGSRRRGCSPTSRRTSNDVELTSIASLLRWWRRNMDFQVPGCEGISAVSPTAPCHSTASASRLTHVFTFRGGPVQKRALQATIGSTERIMRTRTQFLQLCKELAPRREDSGGYTQGDLRPTRATVFKGARVHGRGFHGTGVGFDEGVNEFSSASSGSAASSTASEVGRFHAGPRRGPARQRSHLIGPSL